MAEEINLLKLVCQKLEKVGIAYMLTGSVAANFYAVPRMTRDIDIVIEIDQFEIGKFCQCFEVNVLKRIFTLPDLLFWKRLNTKACLILSIIIPYSK